VTLSVPLADPVVTPLAEEVALRRRVGRAVTLVEAETVAVLRAGAVLVPVVELVLVFETPMLRVCVGDPLELLEWARLRVRFAERVADLLPAAERVVVLERIELTLPVGLEVPVRELLCVAVCEEETLEVLEFADVLLPVSVIRMLRVNHGELDMEGEAEDVLDARIVVVPVEERVDVFEVVTEPVGVELPVEVLERPGDAVVVFEPVMLRVEVGLPVVVDVALPDRESKELDVGVFVTPCERVAVLVEVIVFVKAALTLPLEEGTALRLYADVRVDVFVEPAESVRATFPATSSRLRRFRASTPRSVKLIQGPVILPNADNKSKQRIPYREL